jgi:two-component system response regulator AtoC
VIERCTLFCDGDTIDIGDLPPDLRTSPTSAPPGPSTSSQPPEGAKRPEDGDEELDDTTSSGEVGLKEFVRREAARIERDLIVRALQQTGGNVTHAARLLKISRKSLQTKMKELGLRESREE